MGMVESMEYWHGGILDYTGMQLHCCFVTFKLAKYPGIHEQGAGGKFEAILLSVLV